MGLVADTLESKFSAMSADEFVNWWESILADSPNCDGMSADDYEEILDNHPIKQPIQGSWIPSENSNTIKYSKFIRYADLVACKYTDDYYSFDNIKVAQ